MKFIRLNSRFDGNDKNRSRFYGWLVTVAVILLSRGRIKPLPEDYKKTEFKTSSQRMGVRFTEKLRNAFRHKWIKPR